MKKRKRKNKKKKNNKQTHKRKTPQTNKFGVRFVRYKDESEIPQIKKLMDLDLSEPYSIYTYRYFINNWPDLCIIAYDQKTMAGAIICKIEEKRENPKRGYIAMLVVSKEYRKRGIGSEFVKRVIRIMKRKYKVGEVVLETEEINKGALRLYDNLGFQRDKRLCKYYLNGGDAFRLKLILNDI